MHAQLWNLGCYGKSLSSRGFEESEEVEGGTKQVLYYASNFTKPWIGPTSQETSGNREEEKPEGAKVPFQVSKRQKTVKLACQQFQVTHTFQQTQQQSVAEVEELSQERPQCYALLSPEETCYLANVKGILQVYHQEQQNSVGKHLVSPEELWTLALTANSTNFIQRYKVYEALKENGWVVRAGFNYGADFVIYSDSVENEHAKACVKIFCQMKNDHQRKVSPGLYSWPDLLGVARIASSVSKNLLLATVQSDSRPDDFVNWSNLHMLTVDTILMRRTSPKATGSPKTQEMTCAPQKVTTLLEKAEEKQLTTTFLEGRPLEEVIGELTSKNQKKQAKRRLLPPSKRVCAISVDFRNNRWKEAGFNAEQQTQKAIDELHTADQNSLLPSIESSSRCWYPEYWTS